MTIMSKKSILLIDDEPMELEIFEHKARGIANHETVVAQVIDFDQARQLTLRDFDVIFLDYGCTETESLPTELSRLRDAGFSGGILLMSNLPPEQEDMENISGEVLDNVDKRNIDQNYLQELLNRTK